MSKPLVLSDLDHRGVASVMLNRPEVNNAYNADVVAALLEVFAALKNNPEVRVVVIRGNGRHFQAGADLKWLRAIGEMGSADNLQTSIRTATLVRELDSFPCPTMALIQGACIGGGTGIACACDIVIASEDAVFAISEARWGAIASIIFPQLNAAIGTRNVRRYALSCERFDARKAQEIGLVHEVCAKGKLEKTAEPIIESLLMSAPGASRESKHWIMTAADRHFDDALFDELVEVHAERRQTPEAREGFDSFIEKRKPAWYPSR